MEGLLGKQIEFLRLLKPNLSRLGLMIDVGSVGQWRRKDYETAAASLGVTVVPVEVRTHDDFDRAFQALIEAKLEALVETPSILVATQPHDYGARAIAARLPTIANSRIVVDAGGLMSYGRSGRGVWRRALYYVERILEGVSPGDLPRGNARLVGTRHQPEDCEDPKS